jgi:hypothetical protein
MVAVFFLGAVYNALSAIAANLSGTWLRCHALRTTCRRTVGTNRAHLVCQNVPHKAKQRITLQGVMRCFYWK